MMTRLIITVLLVWSSGVTEVASFGFHEHGDRILLADIQVLTLKHDRMTTARRSSPIPQLKCTGGTAGCDSFVPQVMQCYNRGSDGVDVQWECKTDMDNAYRLGSVEVSCEGYDYPEDSYVLPGSCGVEYTLDLTKEGYQKQHNYYGGQQHYDGDYSGYKGKRSSWGADLITLVMVGLIIYAIYKTCLSSGTGGLQGNARDRWGNSRFHSQPPPAGFRPEYMPGSDDCTYDSYGRGRSSSGGGFWTGAATGGLLGYMLGSRGNNYYATPRYGGSTWGRSSGTPSGSSMFSSGTRTASGFGGTKRR